MEAGDTDESELPQVLETHISTVVFVGDRALKFMKPIANAFIDQSTVEKRRAACEAELWLNRRIAPDVYLGVGQIIENDQVEDCFLVMRRLPLDRRLSAFVGSPEFPELVRSVARVVAAFHARQPSTAVSRTMASAEEVAGLWATNIDELRQLDDDTLAPIELAEVASLSSRYVRGRDVLFADRLARHCDRDGHGDLLADDIFCLDDGLRVLDCIEFDDELRYGDVLADVAFLAMDLERLGRPELATASLRRTPSTPSTPGTSGRPRWPTTTSPTGPRCEPRSAPSGPTKVTAPVLLPRASCCSWRGDISKRPECGWSSSAACPAPASRPSPRPSATPWEPSSSTPTKCARSSSASLPSM